MEISGVCQFLMDSGYNVTLNRGLRPPRIVIDQQLSICLCDGDLYLEDFKKTANAVGYKPIARIPLALHDIGSYASIYLLFQPDGSVKIKEGTTQYVDFIELAHPDSLDLILASVRKVIKQREDFQYQD